MIEIISPELFYIKYCGIALQITEFESNIVSTLMKRKYPAKQIIEILLKNKV